MQTTAAGGSGLRSIVIADRNGHVRETLRRVIEQSFPEPVIVGEAGTLRDALRMVRESGAGVALVDVDLVMKQPAARLRRIVQNLPGLTVIILLNDDLPDYRRVISERWGYRCVAKEHAEAELPSALAPVRPRERVSRP